MSLWTRAQLRKALLKWRCCNNRRFYWRTHKVSPFHFLLLEMLLRKTRAEQVEGPFLTLKNVLPKPIEINYPLYRRIRGIIKPLGFGNIRTKAIADVSKAIFFEHNGKVPQSYELLTKLPHVGRYAANAVLAFSFNRRVAIVDSNVARLYSRLFRKKYPREIHKDEYFWKLSTDFLPAGKFKEFNYALLDFGALVCTARNPKCASCPLNHKCLFFKMRNSRASRSSI